MTNTTPIYLEPGGAKQVVGSGGEIEIQSGGNIDVQSGGALKLTDANGYVANDTYTRVAKSRVFNIDNGAAATIDDVILKPGKKFRVTAARIVYVTETTGTVAGANVKLGTALGGNELVLATAYENTKAVGTSTALTLVSGAATFAADAALFVRHTGIAATAAGEAFIEIEYKFID